MSDAPTDLREVQLRAQIEREVRADIDRRDLDEEKIANAQRALFVARALGVLVGLPLFGASLGAAVWLFRLVAGI